MQKLFLASLFKEVAHQFAEFAGEPLAGKRVAFIPTASVPDKSLKFHMWYSRKLLMRMGFLVDELEVSTAASAEIADKLERCDYIYVAGGNTFFLLQEMNRSGAGEAVRAQVRAGKLFVGESAGAILAAPNIEYSKDMDDPSAAPNLKAYDSLHLVDFYPVPHYKNYPLKKAADLMIEKYSATLPLVPIRNSQAILVTGTEKQIVP
mgnify:CR=1 FL=1